MARRKAEEAAEAPPAEAPLEPQTNGNKPVHAIRMGRIRASIWGNQNEHGVFYSVKISRSYQDGEGWKSTDNFGRDDCLLAAKVLDMAHTWICQTLAGGEIPF
ncbi:hypothetical protein EP7_004270 [Isosphaeraceae bacterium EP7]